MNYTKTIVWIIAVILFSCQGSNDSFYDQLDAQLARKGEVLKVKESRLDKLRQELSACHDAEGRYTACQQLYQEYLLFHSDSASKYIDLALQEARLLDHQHSIGRCQLYQAYILATVGRYNEAENVMKTVHKEELEAADSITYYETYRWIYNVWEAYIKDEQFAKEYAQKGFAYLDTLATIVPDHTADGLYFRAERQRSLGHLKEAEALYLKCIGLLKDTERRYASATCALALVYREQNRLDPFEHYMILAAISDQKIPLKENLAMQELAHFLSQVKKDYPRAQRYLVHAVEDAIFYNNRLRLTEIARKLPGIAMGYQQQEENVRNHQFLIIAVISLLAIGLLFTVFNSYRQNKDLKAQRKMRIALNEKLKATNRSREQYVSLFIELCAAYIDKYNKFQKAVERKVKARQTDDLLTMLHSNRMKDSDAKEFFLNFDRAFLNLYPQFVEEFNALLQPEYRIELKKGMLLNSELRIMALIRLGVKDTANIASLLLYSAQTIYNYRSTLRNHAIDKEHFEEHVAQLCEVN